MCTEDRVEDEPQDHVDFGGDAEFESEIEAIMAALEPIEGSGAVESSCDLETNQNGHDSGDAQSRSENTCVPTLKRHKNFPKPDLAKLAGRARCHNCREVGHFSRNCQKKIVLKHVGEMLAYEVVLAIWSRRRPPMSFQLSLFVSDQRLQEEMERHGLQLGMCLSPPSSDDFVSQRAMSVLWEHVEGCRPLCVVMSPTHSPIAGPLQWTLPQLSCGMGDTLCVSRQRTVHSVTLGAWRL